MADQQNGTNTSSPAEEKMFRYHQDVCTNFASSYLSTELADVYFVFDSDDGSVTRIPAHKILLKNVSDVFEKMFCGQLKENGDVKIVDASAAVFEEFLQFFYLNEVKLSPKYVVSILGMGDKYNVKNCVNACVEYLIGELSIENVCTALSFAIRYCQEELMDACEKKIVLNTDGVFKSAEFLECSKEVLAHILKLDLLVISCTEIDIFEACMEWVRGKSKQQVLSKAMVEEHLGELYYQIRFVSMTTKEFYDLEAKYSAVLSNDLKVIIGLIARVGIDPGHFNTSPRQGPIYEEDAIIVSFRFAESMRSKFIDLDTEEKTTFSTSEPLVLNAFICDRVYFDKSEPKSLGSNLSVVVEVTEARALDDENGKILFSYVKNLAREETGVPFPHPILIRPNWFYTICIKGFPKGHCFYSLSQKKSMILKNDIKIEFHNDKVVDGVIVGLIYALYFNEI